MKWIAQLMTDLFKDPRQDLAAELKEIMNSHIAVSTLHQCPDCDNTLEMRGDGHWCPSCKKQVEIVQDEDEVVVTHEDLVAPAMTIRDRLVHAKTYQYPVALKFSNYFGRDPEVYRGLIEDVLSGGQYLINTADYMKGKIVTVVLLIDITREVVPLVCEPNAAKGVPVAETWDVDTDRDEASAGQWAR